MKIISVVVPFCHQGCVAFSLGQNKVFNNIAPRVDRVYNDNKSCPFVSFRHEYKHSFQCISFFFYLDLLPNRCDFDSVTMPSQRHKRTVYTAEQKSTLEATFRNKMYLSREEKATLASKLSVGIAKVQVCSG